MRGSNFYITSFIDNNKLIMIGVSYNYLNLFQSIISPCDNQPCLNGGTCSPNGKTFACTCADGFTGTTCEVIVFT